VDVAHVVRDVTGFIAAQGRGAYAVRMATFILRLMTLLALVLMPVGMGAPAAAIAPQAASSEHCGGHEEERSQPVSRDMHCAACAALPAIAAPDAGTDLRPELPRLARSAHGKPESLLEIATPPPKLA
jgi:hypothetical protein